MRRSCRRWGIGVFIAAVAAMIPAGVAWGCVGLISLTTSSATVQAGGSLTVTGREFAPGVPVDIHLDTLDGPILATVPPFSTGGMNTQFTATVPIPANIGQGQHILIAYQQEHYMNAGNPARATIFVGTAAPAARSGTRPVGVLTNPGPSAGSLVLLGVVVAVVGVFLGVIATLILGRRRHPEVETVAA